MSDPHGQESRRRGVFGWIAAHPKTMITLCLFLLLIGTVALFDRAAQGRVARRIAALKAAGMPTTLEDLKAAMPNIPDDQNMRIPILEQSPILFSIDNNQKDNRLLPYTGTARMVPSGWRLPAKRLEVARAYVDQAAASLSIVHKALKLKHGCVDVQWTTPAIGIRLPELSKVRYVAKALAVEATVASEEGDTQRAAEILMDSCRLDRAMEGEPLLIGALVRMSIIRMVYDQIERTINLCGLSDASLRRLQTELRSKEASDYYKRSLISERVIFINTMQWLRSSKGPNISVISSWPSGPVGRYWKYLPILPSLDEAAGITLYNKMISAIEDPDIDSIKRMKKAESSITTLPAYQIITRTFVPSISRSAELWVIDVAQNRALQAAIACERYRMAAGQWPKALDALVPDYLAAVPVDPFDGKPLRYAHIDEGIKIWSISDNVVDDGGDVGRLTVHSYSYRSKDNGWVLLNPDLRGRPAETEGN